MLNYIEFLTGRPHFEGTAAIFAVSVLVQAGLFVLLCKPQNKGRAALVLAGANAAASLVAEVFMRLHYGAWFRSVYHGPLFNMAVRFVPQAVAVLAAGHLLLRGEGPPKRRGAVLFIGVVASCLLSVGVELVFRRALPPLQPFSG